MGECPLCGKSTHDVSRRLIKDACGHRKCRLCLLQEESGCRICKDQDFDESPLRIMRIGNFHYPLTGTETPNYENLTCKPQEEGKNKTQGHVIYTNYPPTEKRLVIDENKEKNVEGKAIELTENEERNENKETESNYNKVNENQLIHEKSEINNGNYRDMPVIPDNSAGDVENNAIEESENGRNEINEKQCNDIEKQCDHPSPHRKKNCNQAISVPLQSTVVEFSDNDISIQLSSTPEKSVINGSNEQIIEQKIHNEVATRESTVITENKINHEIINERQHCEVEEKRDHSYHKTVNSNESRSAPLESNVNEEHHDHFSPHQSENCNQSISTPFKSTAVEVSNVHSADSPVVTEAANLNNEVEDEEDLGYCQIESCDQSEDSPIELIIIEALDHPLDAKGFALNQRSFQEVFYNLLENEKNNINKENNNGYDEVKETQSIQSKRAQQKFMDEESLNAPLVYFINESERTECNQSNTAEIQTERKDCNEPSASNNQNINHSSGHDNQPENQSVIRFTAKGNENSAMPMEKCQSDIIGRDQVNRSPTPLPNMKTPADYRLSDYIRLDESPSERIEQIIDGRTDCDQTKFASFKPTVYKYSINLDPSDAYIFGESRLKEKSDDVIKDSTDNVEKDQTKVIERSGEDKENQKISNSTCKTKYKATEGKNKENNIQIKSPIQKIKNKKTKEQNKENDSVVIIRKSNRKRKPTIVSDEENEKLIKRRSSRQTVINKDWSHIVTLPGKPTTYKCTVCKKTFKNLRCKGYHKACTLGKLPFECEICKRSFYKRTHFEYHQRTHTGEKPFQCTKCQKSFVQKNKLNRHLLIHKKQNVKCEQCGKTYKTKQYLKNHLITHQNNSFKCQFCPKTFTLPLNRKRHERSHLGDRPFKCDICLKSFTGKFLLTRHRRTHEKTRPFSCDNCNKVFLSKFELQRHISIHSDVKPYACNQCNTEFRRKDNLKRHIKHHHTVDTVNDVSELRANGDEKENERRSVDKCNLNNSKTRKKAAMEEKETKKRVKKPPLSPKLQTKPKPKRVSRSNSNSSTKSSFKSSQSSPRSQETDSEISVVQDMCHESSNTVPIIMSPISFKHLVDSNELTVGSKYSLTEPISREQALVLNRTIEEKLVNLGTLCRYPGLSQKVNSPLGKRRYSANSNSHSNDGTGFTSKQNQERLKTGHLNKEEQNVQKCEVPKIVKKDVTMHWRRRTAEALKPNV